MILRSTKGPSYWSECRTDDPVKTNGSDVRLGSKCEELNLSKSSPPCPNERTSTKCVATSLMGQSTKSLRSSPLRGSKSREAGSQLRG